ncbi:MAG: chemotaxis protein CheW, partial [Desulfamplus sp.]|nr:chemotaxis protein CheW [Desulfamplus sp.]
PSACKGIDRQFLSGVIKVNEGKRLVMMLNLEEVISVNLKGGKNRDETSLKQAQISESKATAAVTEEEQLVSFRVGHDEYAFDIKRVSEILKVMDITAAPNVPSYVLGMFTIRNQLLPLLDMRGILGLPSLISERKAMLEQACKEDRHWVESLINSVEANSRFTGALKTNETTFGKWLEGYNTASVEVETLVKRLKRQRSELYATGRRLLELSTMEEDIRCKEQLTPILNVVIDTIKELQNTMADHISEDQRAMVVECGSMTIGYLVDWVDEVLRIPKSVIDATPAMASSDRRELKAVAKLNQGERLIMIMDESALVSHETTKLLSDMQDSKDAAFEAKDESQTLAQESMDEEQLVTFSIDKEEYGVRIMQVQEINRLTAITHVPRAPYFIDGMTNLRGNVTPVVNVRRLFNLEDRDADDRTRVIIVDINGHKTGLRVDAVNEVLRLPIHNIEPTPGVVMTDGAGNLMQGVCKIQGGKRMVMLLDVNEILNKTELENLTAISGSDVQKADANSDKYQAKKSPVTRKKLKIAE